MFVAMGMAVRAGIVIFPLWTQKGQADDCESKNSCLETCSSFTSKLDLLGFCVWFVEDFS